MSEAFGILAPSYVLGEEELSVDSIANRKAVLDKYRMPDKKDLWGWGCYRKTSRSRAELACASARATLAKSGLAAADIDALIVCCGDGLNYYAQNRFISELSGGLDLRSSFVTWIGGAGCASLFAAVQIAQSLVLGGAFKNALLIAVDKLDDDAERFQRFGVFSDGACSFIVRSGAIDFAIVGAVVSSSLASLRDGGQDLAEKCQLIYSVFERLAAQASFRFAGSAFFGSNVFMPIQELELSVMPVDGLIAYRGNTARYGHCSEADPVINLVDFYSDPDNHSVKHSLMASTAHGHFGVILLEQQAAAGVTLRSGTGPTERLPAPGPHRLSSDSERSR